MCFVQTINLRIQTKGWQKKYLEDTLQKGERLISLKCLLFAIPNFESIMKEQDHYENLNHL